MSREPDTQTSSSPAGRLTLDLRAQGAYLLREWRMMFRTETLAADLLAAIAVALVALPLSLAIANASGVPPKVGLVTAIVGGIAVALFGGTRLQVSGPAAAMTFLVYEIIDRYETYGREHGLGAGYGMAVLVVATLLAGAFQVLSGVFRLGRFMQFIPRPVVSGFLTGIGVTILCTQLPKILGYDVSHSEEGGALGLLLQTLRGIGQTDGRSLAVGLTAIGLMYIVPRISRRLPTPLIAVAAATLLPIALGWSGVAVLGELPRGFPAPRLPSVIPWGLWNELITAALTIYFLASIESLLSASVVDAIAKQGDRADNDQELIGQGIGNLASGLFGGIPVTGVIARSATNIQAGARTRLSAIVHALIILAMMLALGPLVARIPIAALAGVLVAVASRMIEIRMVQALWHGNRAELIVYLMTTGTIVVTDLIVGVPVGMVIAFFYIVIEMSRLDVAMIHLPEPHDDDRNGNGARCPAVVVLRIDGPLFFASTFHLRNLVVRLDHGQRCAILDMADVPFLDITGAEILEESIELLRGKGMAVLIARPTPTVRRRLEGLTQAELHALRDCPIHDELRDAVAAAAALIDRAHLCPSCRDQGRCLGLERALAEPRATGSAILT